jgi:non-homologous end joining protein Ku
VVAGGEELEDKPKEKQPSTRVIDLVAVLQQSLAQSQNAKKSKSAPKSAGKKAGRSPARKAA